MKTNIKLGLIVGLIAPLAASAQLIDPGPAETSTTPGANIFHNTIIAMNADVGALADGIHTDVGSPGNDVDYDANPLHLSVTNTFYWNGTNFSDTDNGGSTFSVINYNVPFFRMGESLDIGYLGNESDDDNELYITAQDKMNSPALTQTLINRVNGTPALFDYDSQDPNSSDDPPMSYSMTRDAGYAGADVFFQIWHDNLTKNSVLAANQTTTSRFKIWEETLNGERTGNYLLAISDRNRNFDTDADDGFFLLGGDVIPVPEPSQIAALAVLGLGGVLFVRRRLAKNRK